MPHSFSCFTLLLKIIICFILPTNLAYGKESPKHETVKTVNIATIDYPPLMGKNGGLMTDIVKEAFLTQSYQVQFTLIPMARIAWSISEGVSEAAIGSRHWVKNEALKESASFNSIYFTGMHFFYRKEQFPTGIQYKKLEDLKPYNIGYIQSGSMISLLNKAGLKPQLVKDLVTNCRKLENQRIDTFVATELGGWGAINKQYPNKSNSFAMMPKPILDFIGSGDIIFPSHNKELNKIFNTGLTTLKKTGRYKEILENYYGKNKVPDYLIAFSNQFI
jgi:ABC-type amino acid transport substrate-binding protein